MKEQPTSN